MSRLDQLIANRDDALAGINDDFSSLVKYKSASSALFFYRQKLKEFTVAVWGWHTDNEFEYGGSPEMDELITVTAINENEALEQACNQFQDQHSFEIVQGEIR